MVWSLVIFYVNWIILREIPISVPYLSNKLIIQNRSDQQQGFTMKERKLLYRYSTLCVEMK